MSKGELNEGIKDIMRKMCEAISVDFDSINFTNDNDPYYLKHAWTKEQEGIFIGWLEWYLIKHPESANRFIDIGWFSEDKIRNFSKSFVNWYGWKLKERKE